MAPWWLVLVVGAHGTCWRWREAVFSLTMLWVPFTQVYIYSSGSREAQHLLFKHTDAPGAADLRPWLSGYFDTSSG